MLLGPGPYKKTKSQRPLEPHVQPQIEAAFNSFILAETCTAECCRAANHQICKMHTTCLLTSHQSSLIEDFETILIPPTYPIAPFQIKLVSRVFIFPLIWTCVHNVCKYPTYGFRKDLTIKWRGTWSLACRLFTHLLIFGNYTDHPISTI